MRITSRYFLTLFIAGACGLQAVGQTHIIDSLKNALKNSTKDTVSVFILNQLGLQLFSYDTVKSFEYLANGFRMAKKLNWDRAYADYYQIKGYLKQYSSEHDLAHIFFDSAIGHFEKAAKIAPSKKDRDDIKLAIATCVAQKADILLKKGRGAEAIELYVAALEAWKSSDQPNKVEAIGTYYSRISTTYYELAQYEKALEYDKLSLAAYLSTNHEEAIAWAFLNVSDDFNRLKLTDSGLLYLRKAEPVVKRLNNHRINASYYGKLGHISTLKNEWRTAIGYYENKIEEAKHYQGTFGIISSQRTIGICYRRLGEYAQARKYLLLALPGAIAGKYADESMQIMQELVTVEEKTNHIAEAHEYLKKVVVLRDSVNLENSRKAVAEIENKYQATEKSKTILNLEKDKEIQQLSLNQKSILNYFLLALISALLIAAFLAYRNIHQRSALAKKEAELQRQKIRELEKDKQLVAVDSLLKGQEDERSRLAKDLHDGLGGLLSGVKFSLGNMKSNLIMTPENILVFDRSLNMIDSSIVELRRMAHNMMPEMLTKFGLDEALKEYCSNINSSGVLTVKYQSVGLEPRIEAQIEIIAYRTIQELLNNTMKHASATEVFVQLISDENRLSIVVEDNGKGFDTTLADTNMGAGWMNIRSRIDYLKGQLDIHSEAGKGTLVNIEIPI